MNILYLCNRKTYLMKMSRVRFHGIAALSKIANVHYSGIGWNDYNTNFLPNTQFGKFSIWRKKSQEINDIE